MFTCPECEQAINQASAACPYCGADVTNAPDGSELANVGAQNKKITPARIAILLGKFRVRSRMRRLTGWRRLASFSKHSLPIKVAKAVSLHPWKAWEIGCGLNRKRRRPRTTRCNIFQGNLTRKVV